MTRELRILENLDPWLTQEGYKDNELTFTCRAFDAQFRMNEPVYRKALLEFLASFDFDREPLGIDDPNAIMFRLGNMNWTCSLTEFGVRLGIYASGG